MSKVYKFEQLPDAEQMRAEARFMGAGVADGYLYELDSMGHVLSRRRDSVGTARAQTPTPTSQKSTAGAANRSQERNGS